MRKHICIPMLALLVTLVALRCGASSQRAIPDDNLAYPVLITLGNGSSGSGFFLDTPDSVFLVTAKHVLFNPENHTLLSPTLELLCYSKDPADPTPNRIAVNLVDLQTSGDLRAHPTRDVVVIRLFTFASQGAPIPSVTPGSAPNSQPGESLGPRIMSALPGVTVKSAARLGVVGVEMKNIKTFDQVLVGNEVMLFGYPSSLALKQLQQLDPTRPLLRKGIIAGTNPEQKSIILDCPVYYGNSGGPVLEEDRDGFMTHFTVIGVVDQFVPFIQQGGSQTFQMQFASNSGYSVITPMDFVL
jgi:hypothetical protein